MKTNERLYKWYYSLLYVLKVQTLYVSAISESAIKYNNIIFCLLFAIVKETSKWLKITYFILKNCGITITENLANNFLSNWLTSQKNYEGLRFY